MTEQEKKDNIVSWLNATASWELGTSKLDEERRKFRKNLLILLQKYIDHQQTEEEKSLGFNENEILRDKKTHIFGSTNFIICGGLTYEEQTEFRDNFILKFSGTKTLKATFLISKETAKDIVENYKHIPKKLNNKPVLKEITLDSIKEATKYYNDTSKVDITIKLNDKEYNARRIYLIALAIANGIKEDYISPYYTATYEDTLKKLGLYVYNKRGNKTTQTKEQQMTPNEYIDLLKARNQIILQGPPGTGKTRVAKIIAINMINDDKNQIKDDASNDEIKLAFNNLDNAKLIQFHPSYSYEDFVRGISAKTTAEGKITYEVENKILAQMAKDALDNEDNKYILIIDEINRANLSSVLGELIYALEYRDEAVESMYALENGSRDITLPSNLYIIGTMNTADRSIGHIDYAIRRRFAFADVLPNDKVIKDEKAKKLFNHVSEIFDNISLEFDKEKVMLGHSYFIADNDDKLNEKLQYQIKPLLNEYVSDGVLNESAKKQIVNLTIDNSIKNQDDDEERDEN